MTGEHAHDWRMDPVQGIGTMVLLVCATCYEAKLTPIPVGLRVPPTRADVRAWPSVQVPK